jgi:formylglycine-generating enzyme required for sulfatase activity
MNRVVASLTLVAGLVLCPEMTWAQANKSKPAAGSGSTPSSKQKGSGSLPSNVSLKSPATTTSQAIEGSDFHHSYLGLLPNSKGPFKWIHHGEFQMGSVSATDPDRNKEEIQHKVTLTRGFWFLDHEVTQKEFKAVMNGDNPSSFMRDDNPVENVTWWAAVEFCKKLTEMDRGGGRISERHEYRLPTEAEWEYACRAGTTTALYVNYRDRYKELDTIAWWNWNSGDKPHPVKGKIQGANAFGLYDMIGNVWEWCFDWHDAYPTGSVTDPTGPMSGSFRVVRGGGWNTRHFDSRSAKRDSQSPTYKSNDLGFRPVLSPVQ